MNFALACRLWCADVTEVRDAISSLVNPQYTCARAMKLGFSVYLCVCRLFTCSSCFDAIGADLYKNSNSCAVYWIYCCACDTCYTVVHCHNLVKEHSKIRDTHSSASAEHSNRIGTTLMWMKFPLPVISLACASIVSLKSGTSICRVVVRSTESKVLYHTHNFCSFKSDGLLHQLGWSFYSHLSV